MAFEQLSVGEPYLRVVGQPEGIYFDVRYPALELIYNMAKPTENELAQVSSGYTFEIRAIELNDVIMITTKCGSLKWQDAPYNPRIGNCELDEIPPGTLGYGLHFFLTDAYNEKGTIKHMRLIGLGNTFSRKFRNLVYNNKKKNMSEREWGLKLNDVFSRYPTATIAEYSSLRFKVERE